MMLGIEVFGEVVRYVFLAGVPIDFEELPFYLVTNPEEVDLHCLGSLFLDGVVGNALGGLVVAVYWCGWLLVA
jgi:hypothetical protein